MISFRLTSLSFLLSLALIMSVSLLQAMNHQQQVPAADDGIIDQIKSAFGNPGKTLSDNIQIVHLARALAHIPYIITADSTNPTQIKTTAMLCASSTSFKLLYELLRKRQDYLLVYNLYHEPKLLCYLLAVAYDVMRFLGAPEIALKNEEEALKMRGFKINQAIQLVIEICLRSFAYVGSAHAGHNGNAENPDMLALCAAQVADWVEVWRLLSRYSTYMSLSNVEANFNVSLKKEELNNVDRSICAGESINPEIGNQFTLAHKASSSAMTV